MLVRLDNIMGSAVPSYTSRFFEVRNNKVFSLRFLAKFHFRYYSYGTTAVT